MINNYGINQLSITPIRANPQHSAEITSQLLFGELFEIIETKNDWLNISASFDGYNGWIHQSAAFGLDFETWETLAATQNVLSNEIFSQVKFSNGKVINIMLGSTVHNAYQPIELGKISFEYIGETCGTEKLANDEIIKTAMKYLHAPYLWGGKGIFGIDCSGFVQMVYKLSGYILPRDSNQQVMWGEEVSFLSEAKAGDLAFFENDEQKIVHVGILLDTEQIIHASGSVHIDFIDHLGIFSKEKNAYTHKLKLIKRIV